MDRKRKLFQSPIDSMKKMTDGFVHKLSPQRKQHSTIKQGVVLRQYIHRALGEVVQYWGNDGLDTLIDKPRDDIVICEPRVFHIDFSHDSHARNRSCCGRYG